MSDGIYAALSGAIASERSLDVVANNVANVGTTGFRGERLAFHEVVSQQAQGPTPTTLRYAEIEESRVDLSEGPLRETGNPLDLAISGDAFFAVHTQDGQDRFTRDGSFVIGPGGALTTRTGAIAWNWPSAPAPKYPVTSSSTRNGSFVYTHTSPDGESCTSSWLVTATVGEAFTELTVGTSAEHGNTVTNPGRTALSACTVRAAAVAPTGTPFLPATITRTTCRLMVRTESYTRAGATGWKPSPTPGA